MRTYGKVSPKFWIGETGKALKEAGPEATIVGLYLMTSPHSNMIGVYYVPLHFIEHETGLGFEATLKGLGGCIEAQFCDYDAKTEVVWVFEMAKFQIEEALKAGDKRCAGIQNEYDGLPANPFLTAFYERYHRAFHLSKSRTSKGAKVSPFEGAYKRHLNGKTKGARKPHRSQEQEQEQEHEQEQQSKTLSTSPKNPANVDGDVAAEIFGYWQKIMRSPRSNLDDKRRKVIDAALKLGYSPRDLCRAIRGCSLTPFNMGSNERGKKYNGIGLIFRDAEHIDSFIEADANPPRPQPSAFEQREQERRKFVSQIMGRDERNAMPADPSVIDLDMTEVVHGPRDSGTLD